MLAGGWLGKEASKKPEAVPQLTFSFQVQLQDKGSSGGLQTPWQIPASSAQGADEGTLLRQALMGLDKQGGLYLTPVLYRPTVQVGIVASKSWETHLIFATTCLTARSTLMLCCLDEPVHEKLASVHVVVDKQGVRRTCCPSSACLSQRYRAGRLANLSYCKPYQKLTPNPPTTLRKLLKRTAWLLSCRTVRTSLSASFINPYRVQKVDSSRPLQAKPITSAYGLLQNTRLSHIASQHLPVCYIHLYGFSRCERLHLCRAVC